MTTSYKHQYQTALNKKRKKDNGSSSKGMPLIASSAQPPNNNSQLDDRNQKDGSGIAVQDQSFILSTLSVNNNVELASLQNSVNKKAPQNNKNL